MSLPRAILACALAAPAIAQVPIGVPVWEQQYPDVVSDPARQRLTMVDAVGTTWEWDGGEWRALARAYGFGTRRLVHDPNARRTIMLLDNGATRQQLQWDGHAWQPAAVAAIPPLGPVVFDRGRNRAVMIEPGLALLHEWDGATWSLRGAAPVTNDPFFRLVFDAARQVVLLLTRPGGAGPLETHAWDGVSWQLLATGGPTDSGFACAFDAARGRVVAHGGGTFASTADVWEWDGVQWTIGLPNPGFARRFHGMAFDAVRGEVVAFGGMAGTRDSRQDAWAWNGTAWQQIAAPAAPVVRYGSAQAYDGARGHLVLYGGGVAGLSSSSDELWEWGGLRWQRITAAGGPGPRISHAMSSDLAGAGVLLFGGTDPANLVRGDLWRWNGQSWTQLAPSGPAPRFSAAMAVDSVRARVVLHGGVDTGFATLHDTWEWDGSQWTLRATGGPAGGPRLAHDPIGGGVLLTGTATWRWNGNFWVNVGPAVPRVVQGLGFDPAVGSVVAITRNQFNQGLLDTWSFGGGGWTQILGPTSPFLGRFDLGAVGVVHDKNRGRALLYTGTFLHARGGTMAATADIGPACPDPAVETPFVSSFGLPRVGDAAHSLDLRAGPQRAGLLGFALSPTTLSFGPGCDWQVGGAAARLTTTNAAGLASAPMPLPPDPGLRGVDVLVQLAIIEPLAARGFVFSTLVQLRLGD